jgi:hypothetical protein
MTDYFIVYGLVGGRRLALFTWRGSAPRGIAMARAHAWGGGSFDGYEADWYPNGVRRG